MGHGVLHRIVVDIIEELMKFKLVRGSAVAWTGVVRCDAHQPPNETGNAGLLANTPHRKRPVLHLVQHDF
jgi:hypothetical protein